MKKYYTFRAGKLVPKWMFTLMPTSDSREDMLHNRHGKIIFRVSCVVIRESCKATKLFPIFGSSWGDGLIEIEGFNNLRINFHGLKVVGNYILQSGSEVVVL